MGSRGLAMGILVLLVLGLAGCGDDARSVVGLSRPAPRITADMSPAEIRTVRTFDREVVKAAEELGLSPAPQVVYAPRGARLPFQVDRSKVAFVYPGYNAIVLTDRAIGRKDWQLRCIARHEGIHVLLGHTLGSRTQEEQHEKHRKLADVQRALWDEDSRCE
jgi:Zn-dependent protease with chaperone function